ncbi:NUDIX hydrolase [candidate division WOR-3 bacterium]|nr:NUDIX hydrolase [candidate division WOR-3 bacterium]
MIREEMLKSETIFEGKIITVKKDTVRISEEKSAYREIALHKPAVAVVPVFDEGIFLVKQFRYATGEFLWEIPAGIMEPGENPQQTAIRELIEETSLRPEKLEHLCSFYTTPGFSNEEVIIFISKDLHHDSSLQPDPDENIEKKLFSLGELSLAVRNGTIKDSKTLIGICFALEKIQQGF